MKRSFYLLAIFIMLALAVSPALAGAPLSDDPPPAPPSALRSVYLPVAAKYTPTFRISGQIKDANDMPLSGVVVSTDTGIQALTDANGVYQLRAAKGERQISATYQGKDFDPQPAWLSLNQDMNNINFSAGATCSNRTSNPSFESDVYWNRVSGEANGYTPVYAAFPHTGLRSGFTGIPPTGYLNLVSKSRIRTQAFTIPMDATSITVALWMFPNSTEAALLSEKEAAAAAPDLSGYTTDSPEAPAAYDVQYVYVTDSANIVRQVLWQERSNANLWAYRTAQLNVTAYRGRTIKLEFGTYNDGIGGVSSAFFDDVTVTVCRGTSTPCTAPRNLLVNPNFETPGLGWTITDATRKSEYVTTGNFFYSPITSMQSGIPLGTTPTYGIWTTSEFYQYVTIPITATRAVLSARMLPRSTDGWGYHIFEQQQLDESLARTMAPTAAESQYAYICAGGQCGKNPTTLRTLVRWFPIDSYNWQYRQWDISEFIGSSIGVVFGAQDYGDGGNTALYVDDVFLHICP